MRRTSISPKSVELPEPWDTLDTLAAAVLTSMGLFCTGCSSTSKVKSCSLGFSSSLGGALGVDTDEAADALALPVPGPAPGPRPGALPAASSLLDKAAVCKDLEIC